MIHFVVDKYVLRIARVLSINTSSYFRIRFLLYVIYQRDTAGFSTSTILSALLVLLELMFGGGTKSLVSWRTLASVDGVKLPLLARLHKKNPIMTANTAKKKLPIVEPMITSLDA